MHTHPHTHVLMQFRAGLALLQAFVACVSLASPTILVPMNQMFLLLLLGLRLLLVLNAIGSIFAHINDICLHA